MVYGTPKWLRRWGKKKKLRNEFSKRIDDKQSRKKKTRSVENYSESRQGNMGA